MIKHAYFFSSPHQETSVGNPAKRSTLSEPLKQLQRDYGIH
jgi:hypothetical protein